ncbi:MAG TPA: ParB/RepB/Spo0J family partition protein [Opitutaceae bacterium]
MQIQDVSLERIDIYGGTQTRAATNEDAIESYAEAMTDGVEFPPITVFFDGATYWLADGFHRYLAAKRNGLPAIRAEVQPGGRVEALRFALGANATNGVHRTNADKRNAVEIALEEWSDMANPVIAGWCRVSVEFVRKCRGEMTKLGKLDQRETVTGRDGQQYPAAIERQPRGKNEARSSDGEGGGGGGGGRPGKGKPGDHGAPGGTGIELEAEARAMIRKGEINPFELPTLLTANAHDYAETVINLLKTMKPDDPKRKSGLQRIQRWVEAALAGRADPEPAGQPAAESADEASAPAAEVDALDDSAEDETEATGTE